MRYFLALYVLLGGLAQAEEVPVCPKGFRELPLKGPLWQVVYSGYGKVQAKGKGLTLEPKTAQTEDDTHASLVVSKLMRPRHEFTLQVKFRNERSLRGVSSANPWEAFWLFFNYRAGKKLEKKDELFFGKTQWS